mmetsp:Transcript_55315/g.108256  ORF Transcript_55315/g.108256 Transcript_55315/m.108256 type:complete len:86 (-) Transcript_55315:1557-1814(-)
MPLLVGGGSAEGEGETSLLDWGGGQADEDEEEEDGFVVPPAEEEEDEEVGSLLSGGVKDSLPVLLSDRGTDTDRFSMSKRGLSLP